MAFSDALSRVLGTVPGIPTHDGGQFVYPAKIAASDLAALQAPPPDGAAVEALDAGVLLGLSTPSPMQGGYDLGLPLPSRLTVILTGTVTAEATVEESPADTGQPGVNWTTKGSGGIDYPPFGSSATLTVIQYVPTERWFRVQIEVTADEDGYYAIQIIRG